MWNVFKNVNIKNKDVRNNLLLDLIHYNELWEGESYCPECNSRITNNRFFHAQGFCQKCLRLFSSFEINVLDKQSKRCKCGELMGRWDKFCNLCYEKTIMLDKLIEHTQERIRRSIPYFSTTDECYHTYHYSKEAILSDLKSLKRARRYIDRLENILKNYDNHFEKFNDIAEKKLLNYYEEERTDWEEYSDSSYAKNQLFKKQLGMDILDKENKGLIVRNKEIPLTNKMNALIDDLLKYLYEYFEVVTYMELKNKNALIVERIHPKYRTKKHIYIYDDYIKMSEYKRENRSCMSSIHDEENYNHFVKVKKLKEMLINTFWSEKTKRKLISEGRFKE
jgi:hypothetical protein